MRTILVTLALTLAALATPGCRDGGNGVICGEDDEQSFCCWLDAPGDTRCAVTSWCLAPPSEDVCDYSERTTSTWHMDSGLDEARAHWEAQPCHSEDVGLRDECAGGE